MDLSTSYLGFDLPHPLMPGASPMVDSMDTVRRLEDAGASAIVMHSLFEEQIRGEEFGYAFGMEAFGEAHGEAISYFPATAEYSLGPDEYLDQLRRIREAVSVPVFASLNGTSRGGWVEYAKLLAEAGASGLELNVYEIVTFVQEKAEAIEEELILLVREIRDAIDIPFAVKLSPFYTSLPNIAERLTLAGSNGLVLFNRYYQPDIDLEELEVVPRIRLSTSSELLPRLRALAILRGRVNTSYAVTGGVHTPEDVIKAVMCGADAVQLVSVLLRHGAEALTRILDGVRDWLVEHEYESLNQARGSMCLQHCADPWRFERGNYIRTLQSWRSPGTP